MISKKYSSDSLIGRYATLDRDIENGRGEGIIKGSKVQIVSAHYGVEIKTEPCTCCGRFIRIRRLNRNDLTLIED